MTDKPQIQPEPAQDLKEEDLDQVQGGIIAVLIGLQSAKVSPSRITDGTSNTIMY